MGDTENLIKFFFHSHASKWWRSKNRNRKFFFKKIGISSWIATFESSLGRAHICKCKNWTTAACQFLIFIRKESINLKLSIDRLMHNVETQYDGLHIAPMWFNFDIFICIKSLLKYLIIWCWLNFFLSLSVFPACVQAFATYTWEKKNKNYTRPAAATL